MNKFMTGTTYGWTGEDAALNDRLNNVPMREPVSRCGNPNCAYVVEHIGDCKEREPVGPSVGKDHCEEFGHHCGRCDGRHIFERGTREPASINPTQATEIVDNAISDLRCYMAAATIKNPLLMIDEWQAQRGTWGK